MTKILKRKCEEEEEEKKRGKRKKSRRTERNQRLEGIQFHTRVSIVIEGEQGRIVILHVCSNNNEDAGFAAATKGPNGRAGAAASCTHTQEEEKDANMKEEKRILPK